MWVGSWAALLLVGLITWGLMLWSVIAYRKRKDDHQLPVQTRYHIPLEMMYTAIPIMMIGCICVGAVFVWLRETSGSIWPAAIGHGGFNAAAGISMW